MEKTIILLWRRCGWLGPAAFGAVVGSSMGSLFTPLHTQALAVAAFLAALIFWHKKTFFSIFLITVGVFSLWAWASTHIFAEPFLPKNQSGQKYWVVGQVLEMKAGSKTTQLIFGNAKVYNGQKKGPTKVRISTHKSRVKEVKIGEWLAVEAVLFRPSAPIFSGQFNAERYARTSGLGAMGHVRGGIYQTSPPPTQQISSRFEYKLNKLRQWLADKIYQTPLKAQTAEEAAAPQSAQAVSAALLTGIRHYIPSETAQNFRTSGLAHLLAISGLHLGLVAGFFYFGTRRFFALFPTVSTHINGQKAAAIAAFLAAGGYMLLAGASIPTVRAFLMISVLFLAVMVARYRISFRALCLAVLGALILWPESVLMPSFQMSFVATFALILWAELKTEPLTIEDARPKKKHILHKILRAALPKGLSYFKLVWACGIVAGLSTMAVAAWHFQMVSLTGFALNLFAIPLTAFWILPLGVLALFGLLVEYFLGTLPWLTVLSNWFIVGLNLGSEQLVWLASCWQESAFSGIYVPIYMWPVLAGLCFLTLFFYLSSHPFKFLGSACLLVVGLLALPWVPPLFSVAFVATQTGEVPAILIQEKHRNFYVLPPENFSRAQQFLVKDFAKYHGLNLNELKCSKEGEGCLVNWRGGKLLASAEIGGIRQEECYLVEWVASPEFAKNKCGHKHLSRHFKPTWGSAKTIRTYK